LSVKINTSFLVLSICLWVLGATQLSAKQPEQWYEQKFKQMSLDEKIGQLFMVAAYTNKDAQHIQQLENLIDQYHVGGMCFFQNDALKQAYMSNYLQSLSNTPLLIGIDGEWGLAMRLQKTQRFPYAITLGALNDSSSTYAVASEIGKQMHRLGIHMNFAPDVDINSNPNNPIIGFRSFGENKHRVAMHALAYHRGLLSEGVLGCAKHFPGHGDVYTDSHLDMPEIDKPLSSLDSSELFPYKALIKDGIPSIMTGHLHLPQLDNRPNRPASLSHLIIDTLLKQQMGFTGLVITDALNMKGVSKYYLAGDLELEAFMAGNDILLFSEHVAEGFDKIKQAILSGKISEDKLNQSVLKILYWKQRVGLNHYQAIDINQLQSDLNPSSSSNIIQKVAEGVVGYINTPKQIPMIDANQTVFIALDAQPGSAWELAAKAHGIQYLNLPREANSDVIHKLTRNIKPYQNVVISLHQPKVWKQLKSGYSDLDFKNIQTIVNEKPSTIVGFCNPYTLKYLPKNANIIAAYEDLTEFQMTASKLLFEHQTTSSHLPIQFQYLSSKSSSSKMDLNQLNLIDGVVDQLLSKKASPGCRVLVLKDGKAVFDKAYGYLNYDKLKKVNDSTVYDIASITKIAATTLAVMKLYENGELHLNKTLKDYLPQAIGTNKADLKISDILQHRAGLTAWIPFYKESLPHIDSVYAKASDTLYSIKVADQLFMLKANKDTIYKRIFESPLESRVYRYSDLSMILMQLVVEQISGMGLDEYVKTQFYTPMGLTHITYNPWQHRPLHDIAPTQMDRQFRQQMLCGYVHDPAAAMLGGVSGHAGLFSNAYDLAALMQMLLDSGRYNGKTYLKLSTIKHFTAYQNLDSRRGLGFDKPDFSGKTSPASTKGSSNMFGHTGFTGTCAWADPKHGLVYVFLSNRICPDEENKELINGNYRTRIQDIIYKSLGL
jgi:beta-glucosidase-like glycosyl hydrolase/CubicO group peptidase (beta-lactamase class C family)